MCSLYLGENLISGSKPINLGVRNIGEIVYSSLPLTDAGLHLLDGSVIVGGGIYDQFVQYIAKLYKNNGKFFCSQADWDNSVNTYGVCGKFVYDSVNNTVRLPKITGIVEGTTDISALGDLVQAGLPIMNSSGAHTHTRGTMNITGSAVFANLASRGLIHSASGAFSSSNSYAGGNGQAQDRHENWNQNLNFNAANKWTGATSSNGAHNHTFSGIGTSSTVQPQTIKALLYIVVATSTKTDIQVDIDNIATDLNGKANVDLSNITNKLSDNFLEKLTPDWNNRISMGLPQYPISTTANTFTCPSIGYISVHGERSTAGYTLSVMINSIAYGQAPAYSSLFYDGFFIVNKGDVIRFITDSTSQTWSVPRQFFIPMKGAN